MQPMFFNLNVIHLNQRKANVRYPRKRPIIRITTNNTREEIVSTVSFISILRKKKDAGFLVLFLPQR